MHGASDNLTHATHLINPNYKVPAVDLPRERQQHDRTCDAPGGLVASRAEDRSGSRAMRGLWCSESPAST